MKILAGIFGKSDLEDQSKGDIKEVRKPKTDVAIDMGSDTTAESSKPLLHPGPDADNHKLAKSLLCQKLKPKPTSFWQLTPMKKLYSVFHTIDTKVVENPIKSFIIVVATIFLVLVWSRLIRV